MTDTFQIKEEFLGLYNIESRSGVSISAMILGVLIRLQLPIENLRSQTYDGTANMAGKFYGCQAEIKKHQPLARFVNCGAHVTQLVVCKAFQEAIVIRDALDHIHKLNKLYTQSGKFKNLYLAQHGDDVETPQPGSLKPICPTRSGFFNGGDQGRFKQFEKLGGDFKQLGGDFTITNIVIKR